MHLARTFTSALAVALTAILFTGCRSTPTPDESVYLRATAEAPIAGPDVRGRLFDAEGRPVPGKVRAVTETGSCTVGTMADGTFDLKLLSWPVTLVAASKDGAVVCYGGFNPSDADLPIAVVEPGAWLDLENTGQTSTRVAVRYADVPIVNMTLRPGRSERVCVPAGKLLVRFLSEDDERAVEVAVGETLHVVTPAPHE